MKYLIDKTNRPVYLQIYKQIRQDIVNGIYPLGAKRPSIRLLADELAVSSVTVDHAYALLCNEDYVESRERSGFVVIFRKDDRFALSKDGIDSAALLRSQATVLHTTPYRSFPTGITASASKRHEYIRWSTKGERYIIEDDFESEFSVSTKPEETLFSLAGQDNVIYLNTFSKNHFALSASGLYGASEKACRSL